MTKLFVALLLSLIAASCASVRSDVTVSHALPAPAGKTVTIMPYGPALASAPDYQGYTEKLAQHLSARGYTVVPATGGAAPDYIAFFHYGVDGETPINQFSSVPHPWVGSIITYGYRSQYRSPATGFYKRTVILEIVDRARFRPDEPQTYVDARVYSGWVKSEGGCATMAPVIDPMLAALFADFPGQNSGLRTVDLRAETACGPHRFL
jgi:hypothetical protein